MPGDPQLFSCNLAVGTAGDVGDVSARRAVSPTPESTGTNGRSMRFAGRSIPRSKYSATGMYARRNNGLVVTYMSRLCKC